MRIYLLLLLTTISVFSQVDTTKQNIVTKHQIGIGLSKFVNSAFPSDKNAYTINYRFKKNDKINLRSGINYDEDDSETGFLDLGLKLGLDFQLKKYHKWDFYYGFDLMSNFVNYKNINKNLYMLGATSFIGIQHYFSPNFSLSIEPSVYIRKNIVVDKSTFSTDNKTEWIESGLGKIGIIAVNFHF